MRTDTISRDDVQDSEITKLNQQMGETKAFEKESDNNISTLQTAARNQGSLISEEIRQRYLLEKQIKNDRKDIDDLNRRVIQLTASLYGLVIAVFVGVIVYAQFFAQTISAFYFAVNLKGGDTMT